MNARYVADSASWGALNSDRYQKLTVVVVLVVDSVQTCLVPTLPSIRRVRFDVRPWGDGPEPALEILPFVDNVSLVDLVSGYERASGFDVPGTYAGLVLDHFNVGDLAAYLTGHPSSAYFVDKDVVGLLGCDCGEFGCWPLKAEVIIENDIVVWRGFGQPFRPERDYGSFGPFVFRRSQYEGAARETAAFVADRRCS